jgi:sugar/nucleoside kinase (ribokinase family)
MIRILSSDLLVADVIVPLAGHGQVEAIVEKYHLAPGGKIALAKTQFEELSAAIAGIPVIIAPGGSSANMLVTLSKLLAGEVAVDFIGVAGEGLSSRMIRASLDEAGIALHPAALAASDVAKTAVSYVIVFPDGQRTIATYPGNASELLKPEMITDALVGSCDIVFMQGSLWKKMEAGYPQRLLDSCLSHGKELWLALPTSALYSQPLQQFNQTMAQARLLLGNEEELARIYQTSVDAALQQLQNTFAQNTGEPQLGFITCGDRGAAIIRREGIERIGSVALPAQAIVNTLGAGDTAFAGFAAGYLKKLPDKQSAQIAMALAGEKLKINAPRLPDPRTALPKILMDYLR